MTEKQDLQDLGKELLVLKGDYDDLSEKFAKLGKKIFLFYDKIDEKLDE